jgi:hypothetical protein
VQLEKVELKPMTDAEMNASRTSGSFSMKGNSFRRRSSGREGDRRATEHDNSLTIEDSGVQLTASGAFPQPGQPRRKKLTVAVKKTDAGDENFYIPRSGGFMTIDSGSEHVWPVNDGIVNELLRSNQENHLIDMLRAARSMLDRVSSLHNTAILIPVEELKTHIFRLAQCVEYCKRYRVTHHCNMIHPLQSVFEDLIEQFTYELRVFNGVSLAVGNNAKKMMNVSRELRVRQVYRDHVLALVSPLMRRVLVKLLALRLFMQLLHKDERRMLLGRPLNDDEPQDDFGPLQRRALPGDHDDGDGSSDEEDAPLIAREEKAKKKAAATAQVIAPIDDPFADTEEIDPFADNPQDNPSAFDFGGNEKSALFGEFSGVETEDVERENQFAALLAHEAKKLIKKK